MIKFYDPLVIYSCLIIIHLIDNVQIIKIFKLGLSKNYPHIQVINSFIDVQKYDTKTPLRLYEQVHPTPCNLKPCIHWGYWGYRNYIYLNLGMFCLIRIVLKFHTSAN